MRVYIFVLTIIASLNVSALETVPHVDLNRYLGKWYEIARFDAWFEKNCTNVTAEYSLEKSETIKVVNSCILHSKNGKHKTAQGRARVVDKNTNAKLSVSFLPRFLSWFDWVFGTNYLILKLEPDYSIALVGDSSKKYLWILSSTSHISAAKYDAYSQTAADMGFDIIKLHKTIQN